MTRAKYHLSVDDGELTITIRLGPIDDADPEAVPAEAWDEFLRLREEHRDGQIAARDYDETRRGAWNDSRGDFGRHGA